MCNICSHEFVFCARKQINAHHQQQINLFRADRCEKMTEFLFRYVLTPDDESRDTAVALFGDKYVPRDVSRLASRPRRRARPIWKTRVA